MTPPTAVEYRFNATAGSHVCPQCGGSFSTRIGSWPFLAGTSTPLCADESCVAAEEVGYGSALYDTRFAFSNLDPATVAVVRDAAAGAPVDEALRTAALQPAVPDHDGTLLQLAAIDLEFCDAMQSRIESYEPVLVIRTCPEAAAEMLLSGCGEILADRDAPQIEA